MNPKVRRIIEILELTPLTFEGGYYRETYKSNEVIISEALPKRYSGPRSFSTCIYYLLTPDSSSSLHKVKSDEIFHFYAGDPVEMLQLDETGNGKIIVIGNDIENGQIPQVVVPNGIWQGTKLIKGGEFALLGTTVSPGFEYDDFIQPDKNYLIEKFPEFKDEIEFLCYKI